MTLDRGMDGENNGNLNRDAAAKTQDSFNTSFLFDLSFDEWDTYDKAPGPKKDSPSADDAPPPVNLPDAVGLEDRLHESSHHINLNYDDLNASFFDQDVFNISPQNFSMGNIADQAQQSDSASFCAHINAMDRYKLTVNRSVSAETSSTILINNFHFNSSAVQRTELFECSLIDFDVAVYVHLQENWRTLSLKRDMVLLAIKTPSNNQDTFRINQQLRAIYMSVSNAANAVIVFPDQLINVTSVSDAVPCVRSSVLKAALKTSATNEHILLGMMVHNIFQTLLDKDDFSDKAVTEIVTVEITKYLKFLYVLGMPEDVCKQRLMELMPNLQIFYQSFCKPDPTPKQSRLKSPGQSGKKRRRVSIEAAEAAAEKKNMRLPATNLTGGGKLHPTVPYQLSSVGSVEIKGLLDVEDYIRSNTYGMKGKIDCTLKTQFSSSGQDTSVITPFELKSGKNFASNFSHQTQILLYTLLLSDAYQFPVDRGLLFYCKSNKMFNINAQGFNINDLLIARNQIAINTMTQVNLPETCRIPGVCNMCYVKKECAIIHAAIEDGNAQSAGFGAGSFETETRDMDLVAAKVVKDWYQLISQEGLYLSNERARIQRLSLLERESNQKCITSLKFINIPRGYVKNATNNNNKASKKRTSISNSSEITTALLPANVRENMERFLSVKKDHFLKTPPSKYYTLRLSTPPASESASLTESAFNLPRTRSERRSQAFGIDFKKGISEIGLKPGSSILIGCVHDESLLGGGWVSRVTENEIGFSADIDLKRVARRRGLDLSILEVYIQISDFEGNINTMKSNLIMLLKDNSEKASRLRDLLFKRAAPRFTQVSNIIGQSGNTLDESFIGDFEETTTIDSKKINNDNDNNNNNNYNENNNDIDNNRSFQSEVGALEKEMKEEEDAMLSQYVGPKPQYLNKNQRQAMRMCLRCLDYTLIQGMPGTGKSTLICSFIERAVKKNKKVLLAGFTNTAVDNILIKLQEQKVSFLRLGNFSNIHPKIQNHTESKLIKKLGLTTLEGLRDFYDGLQIVGCTVYNTTDIIFSKLNDFDYCILDEASMIPLPLSIGPLLLAKKFILVGDHDQLGPIVINPAVKNELSESLFSVLCKAHPYSLTSLTEQYRMNEDIMSVSNRLMYEGKMVCGTEDVRSQRLLIASALSTQKKNGCFQKTPVWFASVIDETRGVVFLDTSALSSTGFERDTGTGYVNEYEADCVKEIAENLLRLDVACDCMGVIAPYSHQVSFIKRLLMKSSKSSVANGAIGVDQIEVSTVDAYQGRDKDVIIISLVRSNALRTLGNLLQDTKRLNVAFSRAKKKLIIIGSRNTLETSAHLSALFKHFDERQWVVCIQAPPKQQ